MAAFTENPPLRLWEGSPAASGLTHGCGHWDDADGKTALPQNTGRALNWVGFPRESAERTLVLKGKAETRLPSRTTSGESLLLQTRHHLPAVVRWG